MRHVQISVEGEATLVIDDDDQETSEEEWEAKLRSAVGGCELHVDLDGLSVTIGLHES